MKQSAINALYKLKESCFSTLPIAVVILVVFIIEKFAIKEGTIAESYLMTTSDLVGFILSTISIIVGMALFNLGTEQSMTEIALVIGGSLVKKKNFFLVIFMTFALGVLVTIAEPDLTVLSGQIGIDEQVIIWTIGIGVGIFLVVGVVRIFFGKNLNIMLLAFYALAFALAYIIDPRFLPICFDSGGVTTGPVTVPFLLGFGLGIAASHGKEGFDDSFGLTALCSIGPILSVIVIAAIMKATGQSLPSVDEYVDPLSSIGPNLWANIGHAWLDSLYNVALSVGPLLLFFLIYQFVFIRLPWKKLLRIVVGIAIVYFGLVMFLSAVEYGFMPIASKLGQTLGSSGSFVYIALILGGLFGLFGVLAEPAVHVLVDQIETVSDGTVKKKTMLLVMSLSIGTAVCLQIIRAYFQFDLMYYLIPGYILAFALSFMVPKIYTAIAFDSGGVASGPMTSTFILPFCIGFAYAQGEDPYLYGFGLVAMVAMMPIIVVQAMGLVSTAKIRMSVSKTRKLLIQEGDDQVIHFPLGGSEDGKEAI